MPYISRDAITRFSRQPLTIANSAIAEKTFELTLSGPWVTISSSGPSDFASVSGGNGHAGDHRDQEVDGAGQAEAHEERAREGLRRVLGLLRDVDRVLEADQRVEGDRGARDDQQRGGRVVLELERAARVAAAVEQERRADQDDEEQAAELDQRAARLKFADSLMPRKLIAVTAAITASATSTVGRSTNSLR